MLRGSVEAEVEPITHHHRRQLFQEKVKGAKPERDLTAGYDHGDRLEDLFINFP